MSESESSKRPLDPTAESPPSTSRRRRPRRRRRSSAKARREREAQRDQGAVTAASEPVSDAATETTRPSTRVRERAEGRRRSRSPKSVEPATTTESLPETREPVTASPPGEEALSDLVRLRLPINGPDRVVVYTRQPKHQVKRYVLREVFD